MFAAGAWQTTVQSNEGVKANERKSEAKKKGESLAAAHIGLRELRTQSASGSMCESVRPSFSPSRTPFLGDGCCGSRRGISAGERTQAADPPRCFQVH